MTPGQQFPSYQDWARSHRGSGWIYLGGAATIIAVWLIGSVIHVVGAMLAIGPNFDTTGETFGDSWATNFVNLVTFVPFFFATLLVVAFIHGRRWQSIITPFRKIRIRMIVVGAAIWAALLAISFFALLPFATTTPTWAFTPGVFFANLAVVIVVLFFQTTAEELFFRGYLGSWLSLRLKSVWWQSLIVGIVFMLPHLANPELADLSGVDFMLAASTYFAVGFGWMFVSNRTGSIEIAIGAHFINNFIVMMIIGTDDSSLGGASLWVVSGDFGFWDAASTWIMVVVFILVASRIRGSGDVVPVVPPKRKPVPVRPTIPAGWYPDPWRQARLRYWDGWRWTPWLDYHGHAPPPFLAPAPPTQNNHSLR